MAKLTVKEIKEAAKKTLEDHPSGMRFSKLVKAVSDANPETNSNTIFTSVSCLATDFPDEITKPGRGIYQLTKLADATAKEQIKDGEAPIDQQDKQQPEQKLYESDFYDSFALWLRDDLDEVTDAVELGGAGLKTKWGTPDVVGVYKPLADQIYKFPIELVTAEIKIDPSQSVVAFGQAVAYRLFAHKSYVVMPRALGEDEQSRLEALSLIFGVGLVLFDVDKEKPNYTIRARAQRFEPDVFYINEFMQRLQTHNLGLFRKLFA